MKAKQLRLGCAAAAIACVATVGAGIGFAKTSADEYISFGDRYFYSEQADLVSYQNKPTSHYAGYVGVRTEVTPHFGEENVTIAYKGLVNATQEFIPVFDTNAGAVSAATGVIVTYTAASDPTKQLSFVATMRGKECWITVSLTDDLTFNDGYVYVGDSQQATVSLLSGKYDTRGFNTWNTALGNFSQNSGFCYNSAWQLCITDAGDMKLNPSTSIANVLSEEYLTAASENLPQDSPYKQRYTTEYVTQTINKLKTESILTVEWVDIQVPTVAVNVRGLNGQWIGDKGDKTFYNAKPYATVTTDTLYANKPYKTSDLFVPRAMNVTDGVVPYVAGFLDTTEWNNGGTWFNTSVERVNPTITFTSEDAGKEYKVITQTYSNGIYTPCYQIFTFKIALGTPKISAVENASYLIGQKHDFAQYFNVWKIGETPTYAYTVDGQESTSEFIPTKDTHVIGLTVTDEYGNTATYSYEVKAKNYSIPTEVAAEGIVGMPVVLPVPQLPQGTGYTVEVYKGETLLTNNVAYVFETAGEYKLVYTFSAFGMKDTVKAECAYTLSLRFAEPQITVDGEYAESYYVGNTITLLSATATDGKTDYPVDGGVYLDGVKQTLTDGAFKFAEAGEYEVVYVCTYNGTQSVQTVIPVSVLEDEEKPQIIVNGEYDTTYQKGFTLTLLDASVVDNSGEELTYTVTVALNGNALTVEDEFVLDKAGTYTVTYTATDNAGNETQTQFTFTVNETTVAGCNGCSSTADSTGMVLGGLCVMLGAAWLLRRKRDEK